VTRAPARSSSTSTRAWTPLAPTRLSCIASRQRSPAGQAIGRIHGAIEMEPPLSQIARAMTKATWASKGRWPSARAQARASSRPAAPRSRGRSGRSAQSGAGARGQPAGRCRTSRLRPGRRRPARRFRPAARACGPSSQPPGSPESRAWGGLKQGPMLKQGPTRRPLEGWDLAWAGAGPWGEETGAINAKAGAGPRSWRDAFLGSRSSDPRRALELQRPDPALAMRQRDPPASGGVSL
jgi:hypothetical protein